MRLRDFVLLCLASLHQALAQGVDVRGIVSDSTNGERIPFANVSIRGTNRGASTNLSGFYIIPGVVPGSHDLIVSAVGYGKAVLHINVGMRDALVVNVQLAQRPVEFSEVVVESERRLEKLDAASTHVMSSQEIQEIPSAGQADVLRAIQILPGIVSTADVSAKFYVRGGAGDQNLILLDGMRIYNPFHAFGVFSVFDPDVISSTEIFTGAFPAGYGNRLSSVLNMSAKQGNRSRIAGKSELNFMAGKLQVEGPIGSDNSWIINARKSLFDGAFKHFLRTPIPVSFYDLFFKATNGTETGRTSLRGFFSGDAIRSNKPDEPDHSWENRSLALSVSGLTSGRVYIDAEAYTSSFSVKRDSKGSPIVQPAESRVSDDGLRLEFTIHTEDREMFFAGFQFDIPEYEYKYSTRANIVREFSDNDTELWLWFRHRREYTYFQTDLGMHFDAASLFDRGPSIQSFQPRLNLRYKVSDLLGVSIAYGAYNQRVITITNEDDITSLFEAWIPIPEELRYEEAHHVVFGIDAMLSPRLSLGAQSYYKSYPSLVLYNREKFFPDDPDYINGTGKAYGAELLARFGSSFLDLYMSYSFGWTRVTNGDLTYSPRYDRQHTINMLGVAHPLDAMDVSLRWEFGTGYPFTQTVGYYDRLLFGNIGGTEGNGETGVQHTILGEKNAARLPVYYRIDGSITYHFTFSPIRGSVGVNIANLTNRKNILFYDRKTGQQINMLDFFPSATVKLEF